MKNVFSLHFGFICLEVNQLSGQLGNENRVYWLPMISTKSMTSMTMNYEHKMAPVL